MNAFCGVQRLYWKSVHYTSGPSSLPVGSISVQYREGLYKCTGTTSSFRTMIKFGITVNIISVPTQSSINTGWTKSDSAWSASPVHGLLDAKQPHNWPVQRVLQSNTPARRPTWKIKPLMRFAMSMFALGGRVQQYLNKSRESLVLPSMVCKWQCRWQQNIRGYDKTHGYRSHSNP